MLAYQFSSLWQFKLAHPPGRVDFTLFSRELGNGGRVGLESRGIAIRADSPEYQFGIRSVIGMARKWASIGRMREAVRNAVPAQRKKTECPAVKMAPGGGVSRFDSGE